MKNKKKINKINSSFYNPLILIVSIFLFFSGFCLLFTFKLVDHFLYDCFLKTYPFLMFIILLLLLKKTIEKEIVKNLNIPIYKLTNNKKYKQFSFCLFTIHPFNRDKIIISKEIIENIKEIYIKIDFSYIKIDLSSKSPTNIYFIKDIEFFEYKINDILSRENILKLNGIRLSKSDFELNSFGQLILKEETLKDEECFKGLKYIDLNNCICLTQDCFFAKGNKENELSENKNPNIKNNLFKKYIL